MDIRKLAPAIWKGGKPDEQWLLTAAQEAEIQWLICRHMPGGLGLAFAP